jgi:hypothetical protein
MPIIAEMEGNPGSYWKSDLILYNPAIEPTEITIIFCKSDSDSVYTYKLNMAGSEQKIIHDLLHRMGTTGYGSLIIETNKGPILLGEGMISSINSDGKTHSQIIPIYRESELLIPFQEGIVMLGDNAVRHRYNFGWFQQDVGWVKHILLNSRGETIATVQKMYGTFQHEQRSAEAFFGVPIEDNYRIVSHVSAGKGIGYVSVVDNGTQDAAYLEMKYAGSAWNAAPAWKGIDLDLDGIADWTDDSNQFTATFQLSLVGHTFQEALICNDPDHDVLWYFGHNIPPYVYLDPETGMISIKYLPELVGKTISMELLCTDWKGGESDAMTYTIIFSDHDSQVEAR